VFYVLKVFQVFSKDFMFGDEVYLPRAIGRSDGSEADRDDHRG